MRTSWSCDRTPTRTLLGDDDDGDDDPADPAAVGRRLRELATDPADSTEGVRFTARVLSGNLRLLVGMVRANRPWRPAVRQPAYSYRPDRAAPEAPPG